MLITLPDAAAIEGGLARFRAEKLAQQAQQPVTDSVLSRAGRVPFLAQVEDGVLQLGFACLQTGLDGPLNPQLALILELLALTSQAVVLAHTARLILGLQRLPGLLDGGGMHLRGDFRADRGGNGLAGVLIHAGENGPAQDREVSRRADGGNGGIHRGGLLSHAGQGDPAATHQAVDRQASRLAVVRQRAAPVAEVSLADVVINDVPEAFPVHYQLYPVRVAGLPVFGSRRMGRVGRGVEADSSRVPGRGVGVTPAPAWSRPVVAR